MEKNIQSKSNTKDQQKVSNKNCKMPNSASANRQNSSYKGEKSAPDNNVFFEERSNPLSSKGN